VEGGVRLATNRIVFGLRHSLILVFEKVDFSKE
jgi:hypothetical protein